MMRIAKNLLCTVLPAILTLFLPLRLTAQDRMSLGEAIRTSRAQSVRALEAKHAYMVCVEGMSADGEPFSASLML